MSSIFKEIALTPHIFNKSILLNDMRIFERFLNAMGDMSFSGVLVGVYSDWLENIIQLIENYNDADKIDIQKVLKLLDDRHRIVCIPNNRSYSDEEDTWILQAKKLNQIRKFDLIIASKNTDSIQQFNNIDNKRFKYEGAEVQPQTEKFMEEMLAPILGYASIVTIIDPYFHLESANKRYERALEIICNVSGNNHGIKNNLIIDIHTSIKSITTTQPKEFVWQKTKNWPKIIKEFEDKFGHKISINIWEEIKKEDEWHERWIITNQCGIHMGKGTDISEWTDATWGLLNLDKLATISNKFNKNRQVYTYIGKVDSSRAIKERDPKNTLTQMTEEEKQQQNILYEEKRRKSEEERLNKIAKKKDFRRK